MSLNEKKCLDHDDFFPEAALCIEQSKTMTDLRPCYEYLYNLKQKIPKDLFAYHFRRLLQMGTHNVSKALRLKMFEGLTPEDLMYQDELDAIENTFDDVVVAYRGTTPEEDEPGLSWTIHKRVAEQTFYRGRLFMAKIPKKDILIYFFIMQTKVK